MHDRRFDHFILYCICAFTILTEKKRGNKIEIYAFSKYSCKSIQQKIALFQKSCYFRNLALYLKLRACAAKTGRFKDTAGRSACAFSTFHFHQRLEICSAVHTYWHWLAGCGDGERWVGVKTAGDSQKEPVVMELKWVRPQATDTS